MQTPEQSNENVFVITPTSRQLSIITAITNDKRILQDRLDDNTKREKDVVNLILEANNADFSNIKEIQMQDGKLIVIKHPIEKGHKGFKDLISDIEEVKNGVDK